MWQVLYTDVVSLAIDVPFSAFLRYCARTWSRSLNSAYIQAFSTGIYGTIAKITLNSMKELNFEELITFDLTIQSNKPNKLMIYIYIWKDLKEMAP